MIGGNARTGVTHNNAQLGHSDKCRAIIELVVCAGARNKGKSTLM